MKQNPLRNRAAMLRLNPYFAIVSVQEQDVRTKGSEKGLVIVALKRAGQAVPTSQEQET
jgi:hypothetical protein